MIGCVGAGVASRPITAVKSSTRIVFVSLELGPKQGVLCTQLSVSSFSCLVPPLSPATVPKITPTIFAVSWIGREIKVIPVNSCDAVVGCLDCLLYVFSHGLETDLEGVHQLHGFDAGVIVGIVDSIVVNVREVIVFGQ